MRSGVYDMPALLLEQCDEALTDGMDKDSAEVWALFRRLWARGISHGDVAPRNIVRCSRR